MKNKVTDLLQIVHPIIQAPMYGVVTPEMTSAAYRVGCLGSYPIGDLNYEQAVKEIQACYALNIPNFAVNLFVNPIPLVDSDLIQRYEKMKLRLEQLCYKLELDVVFPELHHLYLAPYTERIDAIIDQKIKIVSFTFGNLDADSIEKLKANHVILIGTCTNVEEAKLLEASGIDIVCVQGIEAGGHRGSFQQDVISEIGGFSLLQQVRNTISTPIVYAGGIHTKEAKKAVITMGADGVQLGTCLLCSTESKLSHHEKNRLLKLDTEETVLTKSFSGRYARGLSNAFISDFLEVDILPYPYQNKLTQPLRKAAQEKGLLEYVSIWCGQSNFNLQTDSTDKILTSFF